MNFTGKVPEWSDSEEPAVAVTSVTCNYLTGTRSAVFPPLFFAPSLFFKDGVVLNFYKKVLTVLISRLTLCIGMYKNNTLHSSLSYAPDISKSGGGKRDKSPHI